MVKNERELKIAYSVACDNLFVNSAIDSTREDRTNAENQYNFIAYELVKNGFNLSTSYIPRNERK